MKQIIKGTKPEGKVEVALKYADSIIATLREPFLVLNKNLRVVSANRSFYTTFKITEKKIVGQLLPELGNRQWNIPKLLYLLKEILPKKMVVKNYEVERDFEQLGNRIINLNARRLRIPREIAKIITEEEEKKEEELILLAIEDITERKQVEAKIIKGYEYAESIVDTVREPLLILNGELKVISANSSFYQIFKVKPKETEGEFIYDLGNRQWDIPKLRQLLEEILPKNATFDSFEIEHNFPKIGKRIMTLNARRIPPPPVQPERILLAIEDITDRIKTKKKLKKLTETLEERVTQKTKELAEAKAKDEALLLSIGDGMVATDEKGKIIMLNSTAEAMLEWKSEKVRGKLFNETVRIEDNEGRLIPVEERPISIALKTGKPTITTIVTPLFYVRQDGTRFPVAITVTPVILEGKIIGAVSVFRNITKEKEIDRMKTEFLSIAAHQLRTPLGAMRWNMEMLLAGDFGKISSPIKEIVEQVYESNQRMITLINDLLSVSRIEQGRVRNEPQSVQVEEIIEKVMLENQVQAKEKGIKMRFSKADKLLPKINIDPKRFYEVINNLVSNGIKFNNRKQGIIEVAINRLNDHFIVNVVDNGMGIPKKEHDKVFSKFFRAENAVRGEIEGSGLGLFVVKSYVEGWGGKVWFLSKENEGSVFYVQLPYEIKSRA